MLSALSLVAALASVVLAQSDGLTVKTQQGPVQGFLASSGVRAFLGVPYAAANRWEPPQSPPVHNTTLQAKKFGDGCIQTLNPVTVKGLELLGLTGPKLNVPSSENCLSANIWAPALRRKQKTPVLVFMHGGGYQFGTSNTGYFEGGNFVQTHDDVTFVTFNYRLNLFGQPNAPQLFSKTQSQNFGLLDVEAAIRWVHDNIAAFGGDPERIVLSGHSAAGGAVDAYAYTHTQDTYIKGIVRFSGIDFTTSYNSNGAVDPGPWNTLSNAVGCGSDVTSAQLDCMKAVPADKLEAAYTNASLSFVPLIDDITVLSDRAARAAAGNFLKVPFLVGNVQHELDVAIVPFELATLGYVIPGVSEIVSDLQTQVQYICPGSETASVHVNANVPTWRYHFQGYFPDVSTVPELRAYHISDLLSWFGTYTETVSKKHSITEIALSNYTSGALTAFVKDPQHGLTSYGWPAYNPSTTSLVQLGGYYNKIGAHNADSKPLDSPCSAIDVLNAANTQLSALLVPSN